MSSRTRALARLYEMLQNLALETTLQQVLGQLDVALSTRASEATVANILTQLDVALSTRASEATLQLILTQLDVPLSNLATETTLQAVLAKMDNPTDPMLAEVMPLAGQVWDVSDRWARQLGQVDLARVLGAALSAANPVITGVYDAAGNRMPAMDAMTRFGYVGITDGAQTASVDASNRLETAPTQTTRTSLTVKPEREDTSIQDDIPGFSGASDVQLLAGVSGQQIKVYACGYDCHPGNPDNDCGFRFGTGEKFCRRRTRGPFAQTFTQPSVGATNTALNFRSEGAGTYYTWFQYVTE